MRMTDKEEPTLKQSLEFSSKVAASKTVKRLAQAYYDAVDEIETLNRRLLDAEEKKHAQ